METLVSSHPKFVVLGAVGDAVPRGGFNFHMLSPILVGLTLPLLVIGLVDPSALRAGRPILLIMLVTVFIIAMGLFGASLLSQGKITSIVFQSPSRKVEFVLTGLLATKTSVIDFDQVVAIGQASRFDDDGYPYSQAEIQLRDGQRVALPTGTNSADILAARKMIGLTAS